MDILYIMSNGSQWNNNELRYSLRSIAKNGINVDRVFIVGFIPEFINRDNVICIPEDDIYELKHNNLVYKIEQAINKSDIGINNDGNFLVSSDDHFYIKPTDFNIYPFYWNEKELPDQIPANKGNKRWYASLVSTRKVLEEFELPYYRFNWHGNTWFNRYMWNDPIMQQIRKKSREVEGGCEPTCIMLNYWFKKLPFKYTIRKDVKIKQWETELTFKERIEDREVFSSPSNLSGSFIIWWLEKEFPEKCKYEI